MFPYSTGMLWKHVKLSRMQAFQTYRSKAAPCSSILLLQKKKKNPDTHRDRIELPFPLEIFFRFPVEILHCGHFDLENKNAVILLTPNIALP